MIVGILNTQLNWSHLWTIYSGPVRVVLDDMTVAYGETTGEVLADRYQDPGMGVLLESGEDIWIHPQFVWPIP